jgi:hypothetical protein
VATPIAAPKSVVAGPVSLPELSELQDLLADKADGNWRKLHAQLSVHVTASPELHAVLKYPLDPELFVSVFLRVDDSKTADRLRYNCEHINWIVGEWGNGFRINGSILQVGFDSSEELATCAFNTAYVYSSKELYDFRYETMSRLRFP